MKTLSSALQAHLEGDEIALATCWKLTLRDGVVMGFTDHDHDIVLDSITYSAAGGFTRGEAKNNADLTRDGIVLIGILESIGITESDIVAGRFDHAEIEIFMTNYTEPDEGVFAIRQGWLGEVILQDGQFTAEMVGISAQLGTTIGALYSPTCRAQFGDAACGLNVSNHTVTGVISSVTDNRIFLDASRTEAIGTYNYGKITFNSGNNSGRSMEIREYADGKFTLMLPMPSAVQIGDSYTAVAGCDKRFSTCKEQYSNAVNFRGEPHVPGLDRMLETAATRSNT